MSDKHYTAVARGLHWGMAALIFFQLALGWRMADMPKGPGAFQLFQLHKSIGFSLLVLLVLRLLWRMTHRPPALPRTMQPWEQLAAKLGHAGLYGILFGMTLTGWIVVSASKTNIPTLLFGTIPWPHLPFIAGLPTASKGQWHEFSGDIHGALAVILALMIVGHAGAALKHQLVEKDEVISHMLPGVSPGLRAPRLWIVLGMLILMGIAGNFWPPVAEPKAATEALPLAAAPPEPVAPVSPPSDTGMKAAPAIAEKMVVGAKPVHWAVIPAGSSLGFATTWSGEPVNGQFKQWQADIRFSPDALADSSLTVSVALASVSTGDAQRDESLPGEDWFDAGQFPKAEFTAKRFRQTGEGHYLAEGSLKLRGKSSPVTLDFKLKMDGDKATAEGSTRLDRTVFGVGQGDYAATDAIPAQVKVTFKVNARRTPD